MSAHRVRNVLRESDPEKRDTEYWRLYTALSRPDGEPPLGVEEALDVLAYLRGNALSIREQGWLWELLRHGTALEPAREYAPACLSRSGEHSCLRGLCFCI